MSTPAPFVDTFAEVAAQDISAHTFDLPCGIHHDGEHCTETASWWAMFAGHCSPEPQDKLMCTGHHDFVVKGGKGFCTSCREIVTVREHVIRMEPIKP